MVNKIYANLQPYILISELIKAFIFGASGAWRKVTEDWGLWSRKDAEAGHTSNNK